jgi:hypothetical protein
MSALPREPAAQRIQTTARDAIADGGAAMSEGVAIALITSLTALAVAIVTARYAYLGNVQIMELKDKLDDQQVQFDKLKAKNTALWSWIISLIEQIRRKGDKPVPPPDALKSDPELARLLVFQQYDPEGKK